jgi:hypothetical protein
VSESSAPVVPPLATGPVDPIPSRPAPVRFGLRTLLAVTVVSAVYLSILTRLQIWAVLVAFVGLVALYFIPVAAEHRPLKQLGFDLLGGVFLPILCLIFDPVVFEEPRARALAVIGYGLPMLLLLAWIVIGPRYAALSCVLAGGMGIGAVLAGVTGVLMLPMTILGLFILLGLLGLIPFATMWIYWRNAREATLSSGLPSWNATPWLFLGMVLVVGGALMLNDLFGERLAMVLRQIRPTSLGDFIH